MTKQIDYYKKATYQLDWHIQDKSAIEESVSVVDYTYLALAQLGLNGVGAFAGRVNVHSHARSGLAIDGSKRSEPHVLLSQAVIEHKAYWIAIHEMAHIVHSFVLPFERYKSTRVHGRHFLAIYQALAAFLHPEHNQSFTAAAKLVSGRQLPKWIPEVEIFCLDFEDNLEFESDRQCSSLYHPVQQLAPDECVTRQYQSDDEVVTTFERNDGTTVVVKVSLTNEVSLY
jgi:hypothetical protein